MQEQSKIEFSLEEYIPLIAEVIESGGEFKLFPHGTSMLPTLRHGRDAVALVKPMNAVKKRDIVLYRRPCGQLVLHRVVAVSKKSGYVLCGDNQTVKEKGITSQMIIATVSAIYRDERRIERTDFIRCTYEYIWCFMPLRKLIFGIKHVMRKLKHGKF